MELAGFDLNLLLVFEALFATGSVTGAARRLKVGQPATSAALGRLRLILGDELFVRSAGSMRPTPRALAVEPRVARALAEIRRAVGKDGFDPRRDRRAFTIGSTDYTSLVLLPPLLDAVCAQGPAIDLRVVDYEKSAVGARLESGELDVALGTFANPPPSAVVTRLLEERFVGLARRGHPALVGGRMTRAAFVATPQVLVTVSRDATGAIDAALARLGLSRRIALTLPHMLLLPDLIGGTDLVAAIPRRVALRLDASRVTTFPLPFPTARWRVTMMWSASARTDPANRWLRARIRAAT